MLDIRDVTQERGPEFQSATLEYITPLPTHPTLACTAIPPRHAKDLLSTDTGVMGNWQGVCCHEASTCTCVAGGQNTESSTEKPGVAVCL
jgi:hypothetical protein